jgi:uncharacterized cupredoxin-like copper-binding protein
MRRLSRLAIAVVSAPLLLVACSDGSPESQQTIDVTMVDHAFVPERITVPRGERVTFRFTNDGAVRHEATIGDDAAQMDHRREMSERAGSDMSDDGHGHGGGDNSVTVEPGETESLTMSIEEDELLIGCHEPGHWEEGMKATVRTR